MMSLTPAPQIPWTVVSPFKMRPGLARLEEAAPQLFVRDAQAASYAAAKLDALNHHRDRCQIGAADSKVLQAVADAYAAQTGVRLDATTDALTKGMQEDFVILHDESQGMRTRFLSVCFPSNWAPAEKVNLDFAAIHAPVADNAMLQAAGQGIIDMAFRKSSMLRHVWLLTPSGDLPQHPHVRRARWDEVARAADSAGEPLLHRVFFRVERQTTLPLASLKRGVFFIRVMVAPLTEVLAVSPERSRQLRDALQSMTDAVVEYRGMTAVRDRICQELAKLAA